MAGPLEQQTVRVLIPPGEAQRVYAPGGLAQEVRNFVVTDENTLRSVRGPCPYEVNDTSAYGTNMPGLFHAGLDGGTADMLLLRSGPNMYRHAGWSRSWELIHEGIADDKRPMYPDQFVALNNRIVWSNGIDRARVISGDGSVHPLGFQDIPSAPIGDGPDPPKYQKKLLKNSNSEGYSVYGRIGTTSMGMAASAHLDIGGGTGLKSEFRSDLKYAGIVDRILGAKYYYYLQWEDVHGNLSPLSSKSNGVRIYQARTFPNLGVNIEDITRQLLARFGGEAPENAVATRLYRTPDVRHTATTPQLLARIPGTGAALYPDNTPDSELGVPAKDYVPVPVFKVACAYQGRLVVANFPGQEGRVRISEPGFPGTFEAHMTAVPDSGGSEITGLATHAGGLYAFTRNSVYNLEVRPEGVVFQPIIQGIGCVAPRSIRGTHSGTLIWLGQDAFYRLSSSGSIESISEPISKTIRTGMNKVRMRQAVAAVDPASGEYRCAVTMAGKSRNTVMLCFGEQGWRRVDLGIEIGDMCTTDDERRYMLFTGVEPDWILKRYVAAGGVIDVPVDSPDYSEVHSDPSGEDTVRPDKPPSGRARVFVFDHEYYGDTEPRTPLDPYHEERTGPGVLYRSAWFRADAVGLTPFNVRTVYVGMRDSAVNVNGTLNSTHVNMDDTKIQMRFFKNGRLDPVTTIDDINAFGVGALPGAGETEIASDTKMAERRPFWRKVNPDLRNVDTWAFEIVASRNTRLHLQGFAFDVATVGKGTPHGRVPRGDDR